MTSAAHRRCRCSNIVPPLLQRLRQAGNPSTGGQAVCRRRSFPEDARRRRRAPEQRRQRLPPEAGQQPRVRGSRLQRKLLHRRAPRKRPAARLKGFETQGFGVLLVCPFTPRRRPCCNPGWGLVLVALLHGWDVAMLIKLPVAAYEVYLQ